MLLLLYTLLQFTVMKCAVQNNKRSLCLLHVREEEINVGGVDLLFSLCEGESYFDNLIYFL